MAWNDQRNPIGCHAVADRSGRFGMSHSGRQFRVTDRRAIRYTTALAQHATLELARAVQVDADVAEVVRDARGVRPEATDQWGTALRGGCIVRQIGIQRRPGLRGRGVTERKLFDRRSGGKHGHPAQPVVKNRDGMGFRGTELSQIF